MQKPPLAKTINSDVIAVDLEQNNPLGAPHQQPPPPLGPAPSSVSDGVGSESSAQGLGQLDDSTIDLTPNHGSERESWALFFRSISGLPTSCRRFISYSLAVCFFICAHATLVIASIGTLPEEGQDPKGTVRKMLTYYGVTQLLFSFLGLYFSIFALRRENEVEIRGAIWLVGSIVVFDINAVTIFLPAVKDSLNLDGLTAGASGTSGCAGGGDTDGNAGGNASTANASNALLLCGSDESTSSNGRLVDMILGVEFRSTFLALLFAMWLPMWYFGYKARVDFGWRIFKLCGTNVELKNMLSALFRLRAWSVKVAASKAVDCAAGLLLCCDAPPPRSSTPQRNSPCPPLCTSRPPGFKSTSCSRFSSSRASAASTSSSASSTGRARASRPSAVSLSTFCGSSSATAPSSARARLSSADTRSSA